MFYSSPKILFITALKKQQTLVPQKGQMRAKLAIMTLKPSLNSIDLCENNCAKVSFSDLIR